MILVPLLELWPIFESAEAGFGSVQAVMYLTPVVQMDGMKTLLKRIRCRAGDSLACHARLDYPPASPGAAGTPLVEADIASISYSVFVDDEVVEGYEDVTLEVGDVIYDSLQGWEEDGTGYNFRHVVDAAAVTAGNISIVYTITLADGQVVVPEFAGPCREVPVA